MKYLFFILTIFFGCQSIAMEETELELKQIEIALKLLQVATKEKKQFQKLCPRCFREGRERRAGYYCSSCVRHFNKNDAPDQLAAKARRAILQKSNAVEFKPFEF